MIDSYGAKSVLCKQTHTVETRMNIYFIELEDQHGLRSGCGGMHQVHVGHLSLGIARPRDVILGCADFTLITLFTLK